MGLAWDNNSLMEYLNNAYNLKNLKPELVEKKEPPIITNKINKKFKLLGVSFKEIPTFETLLVIAKKIEVKLLSLLKKTKKIIIIKNK